MAYDTSPIPDYGPNRTGSGNYILDNIDDHVKNPSIPLHPLGVEALKRAGAPPEVISGMQGQPQGIQNPPTRPIPTLGPQAASPAMPEAPTSTQPLASSVPTAPTTGIQSPQVRAPIQAVAKTPEAMAAEKRLADLQGSKAGVDQIHNPWGRIPLQILAGIGETFAPRLAQALPGTWSHHNMLLGEAGNAVEQQQKIREDEEKAQLNAATQNKDIAEAANQQATANATETGARFSGLIKIGKDGLYDAVGKRWVREPSDAMEGGTVHEDDQGNFVVIHPNAKATVVRGESGQPVKGAPKAGNEAERVLSEDERAQINKQNDDRFGLINKGQHAPPEFQLPPGSTQGRATQVHQALQQLETGRQSQQTAAVTEGLRREVIANNQAFRADSQMERAYNRLETSLNKELDPVNKQIENLQEARRLISSGAVGQALGTVKSLVAIAGGQGSGLRVTAAELNSIPAARGLPGGFDRLVNNIMGSGALTGESQRQLDDVLGQVEAIAMRKQALVNKHLDRAAQARSPQEIHQVDTDYRHEVSQALQPQGSGGGGNAIPYVIGNKSYNIPADQEKDFLRDHPEAKKRGR